MLQGEQVASRKISWCSEYALTEGVLQRVCPELSVWCSWEALLDSMQCNTDIALVG